MAKKRGSLVVVGTGIECFGQMTIGARAQLRAADKVLHVVGIGYAIETGQAGRLSRSFCKQLSIRSRTARGADKGGGSGFLKRMAYPVSADEAPWKARLPETIS